MATISTVLPKNSFIRIEDTGELICSASEYQIMFNMGSYSLYTGITFTKNPKFYGSFATTSPEISTAVLGDEFYSEYDSKFYKYNGADWIPIS